MPRLAGSRTALQTIRGVRATSRSARRRRQRTQGKLGDYYWNLETEPLLHHLRSKQVDTILDVGCGTGRLRDAIEQLRPRLALGVDLDGTVVRIAASEENPPAATWSLMDAGQLAIKRQSIDLFIALGLFEWIKDPRPVLGEFARSAKPGARVILSCWNADCWYKPDFLAGRAGPAVRHRAEDLGNALKDAGWTPVREWTYFFIPRRLFHIGVFICRPAWLRAAYLRACGFVERRLQRWRRCADRGFVLAMEAALPD